MDRRIFIGALAGLLLTAPFAAEGQQAERVRRMDGRGRTKPLTGEGSSSSRICVTPAPSRAATSRWNTGLPRDR